MAHIKSVPAFGSISVLMLLTLLLGPLTLIAQESEVDLPERPVTREMERERAREMERERDRKRDREREMEMEREREVYEDMIRGRSAAGVGGTGRGTNAIAVVSVTIQDNDATPVSNDGSTELPEDLTLDGNFPNPFRASTRIAFDLPERAEVRAEVFDILGRVVYVTSVQRLDAGWNHTLSVDLTAKGSGLYIYRLIAESDTGTKVRTGRMLHVR